MCLDGIRVWIEIKYLKINQKYLFMSNNFSIFVTVRALFENLLIFKSTNRGCSVMEYQM